jgi:SAM-dependent methyltransferase
MTRIQRSLLIAGLSACTLLTGRICFWAASVTNTASQQNAIPYVPTRHDTVRDLLWLADVGTNDVVYDLGSGDGRIVIAAVRDFGARRAVGIEINPQLVQESRENAVQAGVANRIQFINGDLFTNDFSQASVVVLYLGHGANLDLRAKLVRNLKPGARVVSHQFGMGEWTADKLLDVRTIYLGMYGEWFNEFKTNFNVPDFDNTGSQASHDVLSAWIVPAPVAGVWRGKVRLEMGDGDLQITLHQSLSGVTGSFQFTGSTNISGSIRADLWGDNLRCWCVSTNLNFYSYPMWFVGHANDDTLNGNLWVPQGKETREVEWIGHRDKADFTGTWEWAGPSNSPVQIKIEWHEGRLTGTYTDKNRPVSMDEDATKPIPITDLYDFGGGFYFTLLLGNEGSSMSSITRRGGPGNGWLIGEAAAHDNTLSGTISFYPYQHRNLNFRIGQALNFRIGQAQQSDANPALQNGPRDWQPKRIAP